MGMLTRLLTLPVSGPMLGALWVARQVATAAERERDDPAAIRARLDALEQALEAGEIDEAVFEEKEAILLDHLARIRSGAAS